jgi:hypothetical protein
LENAIIYRRWRGWNQIKAEVLKAAGDEALAFENHLILKNLV